ncbi:MAG: phospho-N-acetylmuramoyl-pentapeptide-transferase [Christensenellaceae bacterium]|nr:phospho-N-acetylmuramoyl-pentapeptide-transferase [Christensenellaceae bacterium]
MRSSLFTLILSFLCMMALGPAIIPLLQKLKFGQTEASFGPKTHAAKQGTLTMGGILMAIAFTVSAIAFAPADTRFGAMLHLILFTLGFTVIGFIDDYIKVCLKRNLGLRAWQKIVLQFGLSFGMALYCYLNENIGSTLIVPFVNIEWDLGLFYIPFAMFVIIAVVNSANLTDGVDGLCASVTTVTMVTFLLIALFMKDTAGDTGLADSAMVFSAAMAGACLGFLRYNAYPARIFMGDVGSFLLGGAVVAAALAMRLSLLLPMVAVMYVASSLSDIIQIGSIKLRHKKVFRMAPLHHHFELGGMSETRVVAMYTAVTVLCCLLALISLGL